MIPGAIDTHSDHLVMDLLEHGDHGIRIGFRQDGSADSLYVFVSQFLDLIVRCCGEDIPLRQVPGVVVAQNGERSDAIASHDASHGRIEGLFPQIEDLVLPIKARDVVYMNSGWIRNTDSAPAKGCADSASQLLFGVSWEVISYPEQTIYSGFSEPLKYGTLLRENSLHLPRKSESQVCVCMARPVAKTSLLSSL